MWLVLGSPEMSRSLHLLAKISVSLFLKAMILKMALVVGMVGRYTFQGQERD